MRNDGFFCQQAFFLYKDFSGESLRQNPPTTLHCPPPYPPRQSRGGHLVTPALKHDDFFVPVYPVVPPVCSVRWLFGPRPLPSSHYPLPLQNHGANIGVKQI